MFIKIIKTTALYKSSFFMILIKLACKSKDNNIIDTKICK